LLVTYIWVPVKSGDLPDQPPKLKRVRKRESRAIAAELAAWRLILEGYQNLRDSYKAVLIEKGYTPQRIEALWLEMEDLVLTWSSQRRAIQRQQSASMQAVGLSRKLRRWYESTISQLRTEILIMDPNDSDQVMEALDLRPVKAKPQGKTTAAPIPDGVGSSPDPEDAGETPPAGS
jgi:hypothetical protein